MVATLLYRDLDRVQLERERKALDDRIYYADRQPGRYLPDTQTICRHRIAIIDEILALLP